MNLIVSILLWIGAVSPTQQYSVAQIESLEQQYSVVFDAVESDPVLEEFILVQFGPSASCVEIFDYSVKM